MVWIKGEKNNRQPEQRRFLCTVLCGRLSLFVARLLLCTGDHTQCCRRFAVVDLLLDAVAVTRTEFVHTAGRIHQLLLAREEGVALGANVNDDVLLGGAGLNDIAAGTADRGLLVLGMDALFHVVSPLSTDMFTYLQQS